MKNIISITSILLAFSLISYADFETGNSLLEKLSYDIRDLSNVEIKNNANIVMDFCFVWGYIEGVFDMGDGILYESPEGVSGGQILDIAKKYLEEHPESRHKAATVLLIEAFKEAFPKEGERK